MVEAPDINNKFLDRLKLLGRIEGLSTLVLFGVAMPLKYAAGMPMAVSIVGSLHGVLFVALCIVLMLAVTKVPISSKLAFGGMVAAIVPFGPFIYERWLPEPGE